MTISAQHNSGIPLAVNQSSKGSQAPHALDDTAAKEEKKTPA